MSQITTEEVKHVAELAKLEFAEQEISGFTETLGKIIEMVEMLEEVDTQNVPFTMNVADNDSRMRQDVATAPFDREKLLENVPTHENGYIKVPAMLADGGDA